MKTSLKNTHINGIHLYLSGYKDDDSNLEIFSYSFNEKNNKKKPNIKGLDKANGLE